VVYGSGASNLGGAIGSALTDNVDNNLFDDISAGESGADVEYRCIYIENTHASTSAQVKVWVDTDPAGSDVEIALGSSGKNGTEQTVADEDTAPTGVSFSAPTSIATALDLGTLAAGDHYAIWIKRNCNTTAAQTGDSVILRIAGAAQ